MLKYTVYHSPTN